MYQLVFERRFVMGHRLSRESSMKCAIPHGHNEYVRVSLETDTPRRLDGMANLIALFEEAKKTWHSFIDTALDHSFHLSNQDPLLQYFYEHEKDLLPRLVITQGDPSTEMLCACLMSKLQAFLKKDNIPLHCTEISLQETPTNTVILSGTHAYQKVLPSSSSQTKPHSPSWWERPDFSLNDLP